MSIAAQEFVPGMRAQGGGGLRVLVEHAFAPLRACMVGNPSEYICRTRTRQNSRICSRSRAARSSWSICVATRTRTYATPTRLPTSGLWRNPTIWPRSTATQVSM